MIIAAQCQNFGMDKCEATLSQLTRLITSFPAPVFSRTLCNKWHDANWCRAYCVLLASAKLMYAAAFDSSGVDDDWPAPAVLAYNGSTVDLQRIAQTIQPNLSVLTLHPQSASLYLAASRHEHNCPGPTRWKLMHLPTTLVRLYRYIAMANTKKISVIAFRLSQTSQFAKVVKFRRRN